MEARMIPSESNPVWQRLVKGELQGPFQLLALRIMLARAALDTKQDPSPENVATHVRQTREFFEKYEKMLAAFHG